MASSLPPVKNAAFTFDVCLVSQADTDIFKTSVTLAAGDITVSKDGGSFGNITTLPTEIGTSGVLPVALSATEMNADRVTVRFHDAAGSEWQDALVTIYTAAQTLDTTDTAIDDTYARLGAPAGASIAADIAAIEAQTDDIGAAGAGLTAVPWNAAWDAEVQSEATDALNAYDPPTNAEMVARTLVAASYFDPAADTVANVTTVGSVTGAVGSVTGAVGSVTGNVGGNVTGSVGSVAAGGIAAASFAAGAITATAIATGAIDADSLAADAGAELADAVWDEALAGHVGAGSAGATLSAAGAAGDPWATVVPGAYGAGTAGEALGVLTDASFGNSALATLIAGLGGSGTGAITWVYTLTNAIDATAIPDAEVWVTSDAGGLTVLASGRTNASGQVTFYLDAGQIYVWRTKSGWNFTNPDVEIVP